MEEVKAVGIKDLKNDLSSFLRDVRAGSRILVTDRGTVVAELRQPSAGALQLLADSEIEGWVSEGRLIAPRTRKRTCSPSIIKLETGTARRILDAVRGE